MNGELFCRRCMETVKLTGRKTPSEVAGLIAGLLWNLRGYNRDEGATLEDIRNSIADVYVGLMLLQMYYGIGSESVKERIGEQMACGGNSFPEEDRRKNERETPGASAL